MAEDKEKIKVEVELPKDEVIERVAEQAQEKLRSQEAKNPHRRPVPEPLSIREIVGKEIDPTVEGPVQKTTGYDLGEIIKAPLEPPEPSTKKDPVYGQMRSLMIGFALMPVAPIALLIFGATVAISVALIGAALIALGVLVRV